MTRLDLLDWADVAAIGVVARMHYPADYPRLVHRSLASRRWDDHRRIVAEALREALLDIEHLSDIYSTRDRRIAEDAIAADDAAAAQPKPDLLDVLALARRGGYV